MELEGIVMSPVSVNLAEDRQDLAPIDVAAARHFRSMATNLFIFKRSKLVLAENVSITADLLRSLTKDERVLARLEMTWNRRDKRDEWHKAATDVERTYRGSFVRELASRRREARRRRLLALTLLRRAKAVLLEKDDDTILQRALKLLDEAEAADPKCSDVAVLRGELLYGARMFGDLKLKLATAFPSSSLLLEDSRLREPRVAMIEARLACFEGRWEDAHGLLSSVLEREAPISLRQKRPGTADNTLQAQQSIYVEAEEIAPMQWNPRNSSALGVDDIFAHARYLRGCVNVKRKDFIEVLKDFEKWMLVSPELPKKPPPGMEARKNYVTEKTRRAKALECLGMAYAANRRWNDAVESLTESLVLIHDSRVMSFLARVHCCEREFTLAEDRYKDALIIDPDLEMARVGLEQATIRHEPLPWGDAA